jgi:predicted Fe-S protein YdhL (DUF1289 family)
MPDSSRAITFRVMPPSTTCIRLCVLDPSTGLCEGCGRTSDEIAAWLAMSETERLRIMAELDGRLRPGQPAQDEGD